MPKPFPTNGTPLVLSYLRFSNPDQIKGDSLRRQLAASEDWAAKNGLTISQSLQDLGISGHRGKNSDVGALGVFLREVEAGKVPKGSILIIESLDRFSRDDVKLAQGRFLSIIGKGVEIVTLTDGRRYRKGHLKTEELIISLLTFIRAHEESATKGKRVRAAWAKKRADAASSRKPISHNCPFWLTLEDGKYYLNEHAAAVREMFELSARGFGLIQVLKRLNASYQGNAPTRTGRFSRAYVSTILSQRMATGHYQPRSSEVRDHKLVRIDAGDVIPDYFPRVVSDDLFYASRAAVTKRSSQRGPSSQFTNLFTGLLFNGEDRSAMRVQSKIKGRRFFASSFAIDGAHGAAPYHCLPVPAVEIALLVRLSEITGFGSQATSGDAIVTIEGQIADVERKAAAIAEQVLTGNVGASVVALLNKLDEQRAQLKRDLEAERARMAASSDAKLEASLDAVREHIAATLTGTVDNDQRFEMRAQVGRMVRRVDLTSEKHGQAFTCVASIELVNGRKLPPFTFDCRLRKTMDEPKTPRGYVCRLWFEGDRVEIDIAADGRCGYRRELQAYTTDDTVQNDLKQPAMA